MTKAEISKMTAAQCNKAIDLIEGKARVNGVPVTKANQKLIDALDDRIHELDPDRED